MANQGRFQRLGSDNFAGPLCDQRSITAAGGGTSIDSTLAVADFFPFLENSHHFSAIPWNYTTAVVAQLLLCPYLWIVKGSSLTTQPPTITDFSLQGQKTGGTGVTLSSLATLGSGEAFYLGANVPFAGVAVDMSAAVNGNASVLTVEYWNGSAWVSLSATDNTAAAGKTFAQDGLVTWTVPAAWSKAKLSDGIVGTPSLPASQLANQYLGEVNSLPQYWTRWTVSAALDSSTVANTMIAINQSTAYAEVLANNALEGRILKTHGGVSALAAKADAGTLSLIINCFSDNPSGAF